jgi:hypothetical protein
MASSPTSKSAPPRRTKKLSPVDTRRLEKRWLKPSKASFQSSDGSLPGPLERSGPFRLSSSELPTSAGALSSAIRVDAATKALLNSGARPGTPEYERLVRARQSAVTEYLATKPTANSKVLRALNNTKKLLDPRAKDAEDIAKTARDFQARRAAAAGIPKPLPKPSLPNTASGGPKTSTSASKFLKGAGKVAKGLGVVGTALGLYTNVKNDGVAKGVTETAGGVAGAWGASTVVAMGCAALAVTGVGAIACGVGVIAAGVIGSEVGRRATGWAYDHAIAPAGRAIKNVTVGAARKVAEGGKKLAEGAGKVASALNPFDY